MDLNAFRLLRDITLDNFVLKIFNNEKPPRERGQMLGFMLSDGYLEDDGYLR